MPRFLVPGGFKPAVARIAGMSDKEVAELREALSSAEPSLNIQSIVAHVRTAVKGEIPALADIIQTLSSMNNARVGSDVSAEEFSHDVSEQVSKDRASAATLEKRLSLLLASESLILSAKAFDVQHEYEKLFIAARIMTDVRTVFNQAGTEAVGSMIVHNLNVKYSENGQFREVFIALDDADIVKLRRVLERAETKTTVLERLIDKTGVRYFHAK